MGTISLNSHPFQIEVCNTSIPVVGQLTMMQKVLLHDFLSLCYDPFPVCLINLL